MMATNPHLQSYAPDQVALRSNPYTWSRNDVESLCAAKKAAASLGNWEEAVPGQRGVDASILLPLRSADVMPTKPFRPSVDACLADWASLFPSKPASSATLGWVPSPCDAPPKVVRPARSGKDVAPLPKNAAPLSLLLSPRSDTCTLIECTTTTTSRPPCVRDTDRMGGFVVTVHPIVPMNMDTSDYRSALLRCVADVQRVPPPRIVHPADEVQREEEEPSSMQEGCEKKSVDGALFWMLIELHELSRRTADAESIAERLWAAAVHITQTSSTPRERRVAVALIAQMTQTRRRSLTTRPPWIDRTTRGEVIELCLSASTSEERARAVCAALNVDVEDNALVDEPQQNLTGQLARTNVCKPSLGAFVARWWRDCFARPSDANNPVVPAPHQFVPPVPWRPTQSHTVFIQSIDDVVPLNSAFGSLKPATGKRGSPNLDALKTGTAKEPYLCKHVLRCRTTAGHEIRLLLKPSGSVGRDIIVQNALVLHQACVAEQDQARSLLPCLASIPTYGAMPFLQFPEQAQQRSAVGSAGPGGLVTLLPSSRTLFQVAEEVIDARRRRASLRPVGGVPAGPGAASGSLVPSTDVLLLRRPIPPSVLGELDACAKALADGATPHRLVQEWIWHRASSVAQWAAMTRCFVESAAAGTVVTEAFDVGDRHLGNLIVHQETGAVTHVDTDVMLGEPRQLFVPELVPFRFTPILSEAPGDRVEAADVAFQRCFALRGAFGVATDALVDLLAEPTEWVRPRGRLAAERSSWRETYVDLVQRAVDPASLQQMYRGWTAWI